MTQRNEQLERLKRDRGVLVAALENAGAVVKGKTVQCPFHPDKSPSGSIYQDGTGDWHYRCFVCQWTGKKSSGDIVDVVKRVNVCDFKRALEILGIESNNSMSNTKSTRLETNGRPMGERKGSGSTFVPVDAMQAAERLLSDSAALELLWQTRGVDRGTAGRFGIGIADRYVDGAFVGRYWAFPVADGVIKFHRVESSYEPKAYWQPGGVARNKLWPVSLDAPGPVWLCPGELKALAVSATGRAAIGITSGEDADLPPEIFDLIRDRAVALPPDDDDKGKEWGEKRKAQLGDAGVDARIVDVELDKSAGRKDIGDVIVDQLVNEGKDPDAVAAYLDNCYRRSDPWYGTKIGERWNTEKTWTPAKYVSTGLRDLDKTIGGGLRTGGVHLIAGKTGQGKTQLAAQITLNAAIKGTPSCYLSLELGADEIAKLNMAQISEIPRWSLSRGRVSERYGDQFNRAMKDYADIPLTILDDDTWPRGLDRIELERIIVDGKKRFGWQLVTVDYLGLIASQESDKSDYQTDVLNSTALKRIARKNDLALVVIMDLRKGDNFKNDSEIMIEHLRGAARTAYDATNVLYTWCEHGDDESGLIHIRPLKLRFSRRDDRAVQLRWRPPFGRIHDLPHDGMIDSVDNAMTKVPF